jgi:hypothetical protein
MAIARRNRRAAFVGSLLLGVPLAQAQEREGVQFSVDAGIGTSDNILRAPDNERDEQLATLGAQLSLRQDTRRLAADVLADLAYVHYQDDTYSSEVLGNLIGSASLAIVPERLSWTVEDNFGQTRRDPLAASTPDNQENANLFATGPDLFMQFGSSAQAGISARYTRTDFEESPFGSDRYSGMLFVGRELSSSNVLSVHAGTERVTPEDQTLSEEYDRNEFFGRYEMRGSRTSFSIDAGASEIERDSFSDGGPLLRFNLRRELTARSILRASLGREHSDAGRSLRLEQGLGGLDTEPAAVSSNAEPFVQEYAMVDWDASGRRTSVGLSASYSDEAYPQAPQLDRARTQFGARIARDLGLRTNLSALATHAQDDVAVSDADSSETTLAMSLSFRAGRAVYLDARVERVERSADNPASEFVEQRLWVRVRYGEPVTRRVPGSHSSAP